MLFELASATDRINLINKHQAWGVMLGRCEQFSYSPRSW